MFALIGLNNKILEVKTEIFEVHPDLRWIECSDNCTTNWVFDGENFIEPEPIIKSSDEIKQEFNAALQIHLDNVAKTKLYESSLHCASYAASTNQFWSAESQAFISWRDAVWSYAFTELELIESGDKELPTIQEFIAAAPQINW